MTFKANSKLHFNYV